MSKIRISEAEKSKTKYPDNYTDSFDLDILKKTLEGISIQTIAESRNLSQGIVSMRLRNTMVYLQNQTNKSLNKEFYQYPYQYRHHWNGLIKTYEFKKALNEPSSIHNLFMEYYKSLDLEHKLMLIQECEFEVEKQQIEMA